MLNIEVIKFEAQDVITASVAAPVEPVAPVVNCDCAVYGPCEIWDGGLHIHPDANGDPMYCSGINGEHGCGN